MKEEFKKLLDGIGIKIRVAFGYQGKKIDPQEKHCIICGDKRKDHPGRWSHEFQEFDAQGRGYGQV